MLHTAGESWAVPRNPLALVTTAENFTREDIDFLSQAAGQIAIAIENAPAYQDNLQSQRKAGPGEALSRRRNPRGEMNFEQIVGKARRSRMSCNYCRDSSTTRCMSFAPLCSRVGVIGTTFAVEAGINKTIVLATVPPPDLSRILLTWLVANHIRALSALAAFVVSWLAFRRSVNKR